MRSPRVTVGIIFVGLISSAAFAAEPPAGLPVHASFGIVDDNTVDLWLNKNTLPASYQDASYQKFKADFDRVTAELAKKSNKAEKDAAALRALKALYEYYIEPGIDTQQPSGGPHERWRAAMVAYKEVYQITWGQSENYKQRQNPTVPMTPGLAQLQANKDEAESGKAEVRTSTSPHDVEELMRIVNLSSLPTDSSPGAAPSIFDQVHDFMRGNRGAEYLSVPIKPDPARSDPKPSTSAPSPAPSVGTAPNTGIKIDPALTRTGGSAPQKLVGNVHKNTVVPAGSQSSSSALTSSSLDTGSVQAPTVSFAMPLKSEAGLTSKPNLSGASASPTGKTAAVYETNVLDRLRATNPAQFSDVNSDSVRYAKIIIPDAFKSGEDPDRAAERIKAVVEKFLKERLNAAEARKKSNAPAAKRPSTPVPQAPAARLAEPTVTRDSQVDVGEIASTLLSIGSMIPRARGVTVPTASPTVRTPAPRVTTPTFRAASPNRASDITGTR